MSLFMSVVLLIGFCFVNSLGLASTLTGHAVLQDEVLDVVMRLKLELEQVTRRMSFLEEENEGMKKRIEKLEVTNKALVENIEFTTDSSVKVQKWKAVNDQAAGNTTLSQRKTKRLLLPGEPVAFTAVLTHDVTVGPLQTIEYNKVITNIGNGYDVRHGYFTSPVKGIYLFSATICSQSDQGVRTEMMVNGVQIAAMYGDDYDLGSHTVVAVLEQNDQVWIRHFNEGTSSVHAGGDRYYSSFSGVLIHSLQ